jgi:hypothetical protein
VVDVANTRFDWEKVATDNGASALHRQPARLASVIGAGLLVVAGFFPFAEGRVPRPDGTIGHPKLGGFDGAGDGAILLAIGLVALFLVVNQAMAESSVTVVHYGPPILGLVACLICMTAWRETQQWIDALEKTGSTAALGIGLWLAAAGSSVLLVSGTYRSISERDEAPAGAAASPRPGRADLAEAIGAVIGGLGVSVGLLALAVTLLPPSLIAVYAFAVILGGLFGMSLGARFGRWIAQ